MTETIISLDPAKCRLTRTLMGSKPVADLDRIVLYDGDVENHTTIYAGYTTNELWPVSIINTALSTADLAITMWTDIGKTLGKLSDRRGVPVKVPP